MKFLLHLKQKTKHWYNMWNSTFSYSLNKFRHILYSVKYQRLHNVSPPKIISIWFSPITFRCKNLAPWYFNSPTKGRILLKYQKYCLAVNFDMNSILVWIIWLFLILIHTEYFYFLGGETLCKPWYQEERDRGK